MWPLVWSCRRQKDLLNKWNKKGETPLIIACKQASKDTVSLLLTCEQIHPDAVQGAGDEQPSGTSMPPASPNAMLCAIERGDAATVRMLVGAGSTKFFDMGQERVEEMKIKLRSEAIEPEEPPRSRG